MKKKKSPLRRSTQSIQRAQLASVGGGVTSTSSKTTLGEKLLEAAEPVKVNLSLYWMEDYP